MSRRIVGVVRGLLESVFGFEPKGPVDSADKTLPKPVYLKGRRFRRANRFRTVATEQPIHDHPDHKREIETESEDRYRIERYDHLEQCARCACGASHHLDENNEYTKCLSCKRCDGFVERCVFCEHARVFHGQNGCEAFDFHLHYEGNRLVQQHMTCSFHCEEFLPPPRCKADREMVIEKLEKAVERLERRGGR